MNIHCMAMRLSALIAAAAFYCSANFCEATERSSSYLAALESISAQDIQEHVNFLADDALEGRECGSSGGRLAAEYLRRELKNLHIRGGGDGGRFEQPFDPEYRNILGIIQGSDPQLKDEVVIIGAHYDHVGYGTEENSAGPIGQIHNGADDNASGTSMLLELAEALVRLPQAPRRSILLAFWDAEEVEMLGSRYWIANPTVPSEQVVAAINLDMVGRLRDNLLTVYGTRTGYGLRKLLSRQNRIRGLKIDFSWELEDDSDHYTFFEAGIPVLFMHTGLHDEFHSPRDDADLIDDQGMERVARLVFHVLRDLAERPETPNYRKVAASETEEHREKLTERIPADREPAAPQQPAPEEQQYVKTNLGENPTRLGITFREDDAEPGVIIITSVAPGLPAMAAGLQRGDRIYQVGSNDFVDGDAFLEMIGASPDMLRLLVERNGRLRTFILHIRGAIRPEVI